MGTSRAQDEEERNVHQFGMGWFHKHGCNVFSCVVRPASHAEKRNSRMLAHATDA